MSQSLLFDGAFVVNFFNEPDCEHMSQSLLFDGAYVKGQCLQHVRTCALQVIQQIYIC